MNIRYAHIYKARGGKVVLMLTTGTAISMGVIRTLYFKCKNQAAKFARSIGAVAHNY